MEYKDSKGQVYEISYSQKLQREQNKILRQKNKLLVALLFLLIVFGIGAIYLYMRLAAIDFLTNLNGAISAVNVMG